MFHFDSLQSSEQKEGESLVKNVSANILTCILAFCTYVHYTYKVNPICHCFDSPKLEEGQALMSRLIYKR